MRSKWMARVAAPALAAVALSALAVSVQAAPEGQDGTAARQQVSGYEIVTLPNANVPNFQRRVAECPAGKKVIGGGAEAQGSDAVLVGSFPTSDGTGWVGIGRQANASTVGISVFAVCASVPTTP